MTSSVAYASDSAAPIAMETMLKSVKGTLAYRVRGYVRGIVTQSLLVQVTLIC